jgi:bifunctional oligoribonuclease and PAP phosphatase NrnA
MNTKKVESVKQLLNQSKKIVIIPHRNPDGDAMGSCLGLYHILNQLGHSVQVVSPNEYPDFLAWMPSAEKVLVYESNTNESKRVLKEAEVIFTLDFNALHRTGVMGDFLKELNVPFVMIDHHEKPDDYATVTYSDTQISSTCEMVYLFAQALGWNDLMDKTVGTCLYTGMMTDTGSFKYASTTASTHRIVAELKDLGVETATVHHLLFDNNSPNRLQILGQALQNLKLLPQYKTSYISLSQDELNKYNYKKGDTEGIVNYGLSIKDIIFTAFFSENKEEGIIKISFRSIGDFDVNQFARNYFEGGGHKNAAGGKSALSLQETVNKFETILAENYTINEK